MVSVSSIKCTFRLHNFSCVFGLHCKFNKNLSHPIMIGEYLVINIIYSLYHLSAREISINDCTLRRLSFANKYYIMLILLYLKMLYVNFIVILVSMISN